MIKSELPLLSSIPDEKNFFILFLLRLTPINPSTSLFLCDDFWEILSGSVFMCNFSLVLSVSR